MREGEVRTERHENPGTESIAEAEQDRTNKESGDRRPRDHEDDRKRHDDERRKQSPQATLSIRDVPSGIEHDRVDEGVCSEGECHDLVTETKGGSPERNDDVLIGTKNREGRDADPGNDGGT